MKNIIWQTFALICVLGLAMPALAQTEPVATPDANSAPVVSEPTEVSPPPEVVDAIMSQAGTNSVETNAAPTTNLPTVVLEDQPAAPGGSNSVPETFLPPTQVSTNADELRLNFRNAPLEMVLNYLSDAAGFIIVLDTPVHGNVNVISSHPMTRNEAVDLLNSVLNKNGLAAIRDGRTLTIVDKNDAKTRAIPVKVSNDPEQIPKNAEIVTQIIPVRFVEARQLVTDLASFVSAQATIVANEAGNSVVITDTQSNIRHLVEIIRAIDNSAEGETEIRVFRLEHANPTDVATELGEIFPSSTSSGNSNNQSPIRFGGGGPGGFFSQMMGGRGGGGGNGGASQPSRQQKQTQVTAVADLRTSSVIVTASKDLMQEIAGMMAQLDVVSPRDQKVFVFHMNNGDPQQTLQVLQGMFGGSTTAARGGSSTASSANSALMTRQQNNATTTGNSSSTTSSTFGGGTSGGAGGSGRQAF